MEDRPRGADAGSARLDRFVGDGWVAAGDAALSFDPLSSQGMLTALYTGMKAGQALSAHLAGDGGALEAYADARRTLVDELGTDPGRELQELQRAVLRQDPALDAPQGAVPGLPRPQAAESRKIVTVVVADVAGVRFARAMLAASPDAWKPMLARLDGEDAILPAFEDLPEHLTEAEFRARFGDVDSASYAAMVADIDARVAALPFYADANSLPQ